jgi:hypothetical protein
LEAREVDQNIPPDPGQELETSQKYGFYVEAENEDGTATGEEKTFTTASTVEFAETGPFEVRENASDDATVGDVDAVDVEEDSDPDVGISYEIVAGNDPDGNNKDAFKIDFTSGVVEVRNSGEIDYEERSQYSLTVKASSGETVENSQNAAVDINIINVIEPPVDLAAEPNVAGAIGEGNSSVALEWEAPPNSDTDIDRYNIYRSTTPISEGTDPSGFEPTLTAETGLSAPKVDVEPDLGQTYYYRLTAVSTSGEEGEFSSQASAFTYPKEVDAQAERTFDQSSRKQDYRLIGLPGRAEVETRPLREVLPGEEDKTWRAFWDDGTSSSYYVEHDGSETFLVEPGDGFWVLSTEDWTDGSQYPAVQLEGDSAATIGLHEGWNIVSNPTGKDVSWDHVQEENGLSGAALWRFDGSFEETQTLVSARAGEAFYFLNDDDLGALRVPYPDSPPETRDATSDKSIAAVSTRKDSSVPTIVLEASQGASATSEATVQFVESAEEGFGTSDVVAPTSRFSALGLRLKNPDEDHKPRRGYLAAERRPTGSSGLEGSSGQEFFLHLWSRAEGPVTLSTGRLENMGEWEVTLIIPGRQEAYDLTEQTEVTLSPEADTTRMRLAVGTSEYVQDQKRSVVPEEISLEAYPNPARQQATLRYALTEPKAVRLEVFDALGRKVATVASGRKEPGRHQARIDASRLSSGVYFGRLQAGDQTRTRRIVIVK